jgi:hypothetical protein
VTANARVVEAVVRDGSPDASSGAAHTDPALTLRAVSRALMARLLGLRAGLTSRRTTTRMDREVRGVVAPVVSDRVVANTVDSPAIGVRVGRLEEAAAVSLRARAAPGVTNRTWRKTCRTANLKDSLTSLTSRLRIN